jgi:viroplasmin and RNaseH domain-containing protein
MTYCRKPDLSEIDEQIRELTPEKILERWRERREIAQSQDIFKRKDVEYKVSTIKSLTSSIENIQQNVLYEIYSMEKKKEDTEALVKTLQQTNNPYSVPIVTKPTLDLEEKIRQENLQRQENLNFLNLSKKDD